jgi:hypothetical protein
MPWNCQLLTQMHICEPSAMGSTAREPASGAVLGKTHPGMQDRLGQEAPVRRWRMGRRDVGLGRVCVSSRLGTRLAPTHGHPAYYGEH